MATADTSTVNQSLLGEYLELDSQRKELEAKIEEIKARLANVHSMLLDDFLEQGIQSVNMNGRCAYLRYDFLCTRKATATNEQVIDLLKQHGMNDLVGEGYNAASLKSRVREMKDAGQLPEELESVLFINTVPKIVVCKAKK